MPYQPSSRLPGERASKLGHLDVLNSELVRNICTSFESQDIPSAPASCSWENFPAVGKPLRFVFSVDGSLQTVESGKQVPKRLAFVKTALLRLDQRALSKLDRDNPHPLILKDILSNSAMYHATVFPLKNVSTGGMTVFDAVRKIVYDSLRDPSLEREPYETLRWLAFEAWDKPKPQLPNFGCPHCAKENATLRFGEDISACPDCGGEIYLTDMLGFHQEMIPDSAADSVATSYMLIHETLLLFTAIRHFWTENKAVLAESLFIKDGPLSIRAQYSKLVNPIRNFLEFAKSSGYPVNLVGQEKTGAFVDHLAIIKRNRDERQIFVPGHDYIRTEIQQRPIAGRPYGFDTNYGAKVFLKWDSYHSMVLNLTTGAFTANPTKASLIGLDRVLATLPAILSNRFEGALLPIELANGVASLSTYPSAKILQIFTESQLDPA